jgi:hypothetical protein
MGPLGFPEITVLVVVALVALHVSCLPTLERFLQKCAPESRALSPRSVWLMLIPLFNGVWHFILVRSGFRKRCIMNSPAAIFPTQTLNRLDASDSLCARSR